MENEVGEGNFNVQCHEGKNGKMVHFLMKKNSPIFKITNLGKGGCVVPNT